MVGWSFSIRTQNKIGAEIKSDRHDNVLEGIEIIGISHALARPWYVDVSCKVNLYTIHQKRALLSNACSNTTMQMVAVISRWIETSIFMHMNRYIEHVRVIVECLLNSITCSREPISTQRED